MRAYEIVQSNRFATATLGTEESGHSAGKRPLWEGRVGKGVK